MPQLRGKVVFRYGKLRNRACKIEGINLYYKLSGNLCRTPDRQIIHNLSRNAKKPSLIFKGFIVHYYQFNIGDYSSHTSRLSIYEDIAYRRLLDLYYLSERPLNGCSEDVAREIGMADCLSDVEYVLKKFFIEKNNAFHNKRCDLDIRAYQSKQKTAKKAGIASGIARKNKRTTVERPLNTKGTGVEPTINHKPLTNNQETKIKIRAFAPPSIKDVQKYINEKKYKIDPEYFISFYESKGWMVGKNKMKNWKAALTGWNKRNEDQNNGQNKQDNRSRAKRVSDKFDELAKNAVARGETF